VSAGKREWTFHVHADGRYAGINDGRSGETILRIGGQPGEPGWRDVEKVREFEKWLADEIVPSASVTGLLDALRYIAGEDVAGMDAHLRPKDVALDALAQFNAEDN
jgi:hypothetical protein